MTVLLEYSLDLGATWDPIDTVFDSDPDWEGPDVKFGRKVAYPVLPLIEWLNKHLGVS